MLPLIIPSVCLFCHCIYSSQKLDLDQPHLVICSRDGCHIFLSINTSPPSFPFSAYWLLFKEDGRGDSGESLSFYRASCCCCTVYDAEEMWRGGGQECLPLSLVECKDSTGGLRSAVPPPSTSKPPPGLEELEKEEAAY